YTTGLPDPSPARALSAWQRCAVPGGPGPALVTGPHLARHGVPGHGPLERHQPALVEQPEADLFAPHRKVPQGELGAAIAHESADGVGFLGDLHHERSARERLGQSELPRAVHARRDDVAIES